MITINEYTRIVTMSFLNLFTVYNPYILRKSGGSRATWNVYSSYDSPLIKGREKNLFFKNENFFQDECKQGDFYKIIFFSREKEFFFKKERGGIF